MSEVVLYIIDAEKYFEGLVSILKNSNAKKEIIYVTTNKPYKNIMDILNKRKIKIKKVFFIDCISRHIGDKLGVEPDNCIFIEGPQNLTTLSIAINEAVKRLSGNKVLLLDSLSTLLLYNDARTIGQFTNFFINKMRAADVETIMLALESDVDKDVIKQIQSFSDKVKKV